MTLFKNTENKIPKCIWNLKGPQRATIILKKKKKNWNITLPDFKIDYKDVVIKTVWYWHEDRHIETNE